MYLCVYERIYVTDTNQARMGLFCIAGLQVKDCQWQLVIHLNALHLVEKVAATIA